MIVSADATARAPGGDQRARRGAPCRPRPSTFATQSGDRRRRARREPSAACWPRRGNGRALTPLARDAAAAVVAVRRAAALRRALYRSGLRATRARAGAGARGRQPRGRRRRQDAHRDRTGRSCCGSAATRPAWSRAAMAAASDDCAMVDAHQHAPTTCGDEPLLIRLRTRAPVVVARAPHRRGARAAASAHPELDLLVGDDGLQHLRAGARRAVIVFDERGIGNGWLLPAGPLREPLPARLPSAALVLYNADARQHAAGPASWRSAARAVWCSWPAGGAASRRAASAGTRCAAAASWPAPASPCRSASSRCCATQGLTIEPICRCPTTTTSSTLPWPADAADVVSPRRTPSSCHPAASGSTRVWVAPLDFELDPQLRRRA